MVTLLRWLNAEATKIERALSGAGWGHPWSMAAPTIRLKPRSDCFDRGNAPKQRALGTVGRHQQQVRVHAARPCIKKMKCCRFLVPL